VLAYDKATGETGDYTLTVTRAHIDPVVTTLTLDGEEIESTLE
jgi:hypothetical protein